MNRERFLRIKELLDEKEYVYNNVSFIYNDPICIPHRFFQLQDIEIMGFFASIFAWGKRSLIIKKCEELIARFDNTPYEFIKGHSGTDLKQLLGFKHRTFNDTDLLYLVNFLQIHYSKYSSLEDAFIAQDENADSIEKSLVHFHNYVFESAEPNFRTRKHISTPANKSACKRLNMFLRWMVRHDANGVDFGLWHRFHSRNLICPLDLHVDRTARILGLINRRQADWMAAEELTQYLRLFDSEDPVKYDFALFGMSIEHDLP